MTKYRERAGILYKLVNNEWKHIKRGTAEWERAMQTRPDATKRLKPIQ